ncbi:7990_t:CDS:2, partial [Diversispora eburnea]
IYMHYDLECAKENRLKVYLMNKSSNVFIYKKNTHITGSDMFEKWDNILYNIKKEGGTAGKVTRKRISEIVRPLGDQVKRIHANGFIVAGQVNLKTDIEMCELKLEKRGVCTIKNCISIIWKPLYPEIPNLIIFKKNEFHSTNSLPDFKKKQQDKEQNTEITIKRKSLKRFDLNLPNEIIIEIFQHLRTQNDKLDTECLVSQCTNNELLSLVLYVNKRWNEYKLELINTRETLRVAEAWNIDNESNSEENFDENFQDNNTSDSNMTTISELVYAIDDYLDNTRINRP